jgi:CRP-like cAMP-binding protein
MPLQDCYLFEGLSELQLHRLAEICREKHFQKDQWLFHEGQTADRLFLLKDGKVELLTKIGDITELPITIIRSSGSCFGIAALVAPYLYSLTARSTEDCSVIAIKRADLERLIRKDYELGFTIMSNMSRYLLKRVKETREELKIHFKTLVKSAHA